jgi:cobalt/nickel transport system permease protein
VLVMTSVVAVQALIFQDGGLLVMGANLFNMAVIGPFVAHMVYRFVLRLARGQTWGIFAGGAVAAWASIEVAALACGLQLAVSGTSPANLAIPALAGIHALIGVGEALITFGALSIVFAARPDLFKQGQAQPASNKVVWAAGLVLTLLLVVLSPMASANPDGLEWVAEQAGFIQTAQSPTYEIIPDYVMPGISDGAAATILAGMIGALIVMGVAMLMAFTRRNRQRVSGD